MTETEFALLVDLHKDNPRQGPGRVADTGRAIELSGLSPSPALRLADIGCGTGAAALVLARRLGGHVTAIDLSPVFLDTLRRRAGAEGLAGDITPVAASMEALPFAPGTFDAIWSEGAIYCMGFAAGLAAFRPLLRPGGILAVSELTWLTDERPAELEAHWSAAYPEVGTAAAKLAAMRAAGYTPLGWFPLPASAWLDAYYAPLRARFPAFLARHADTPLARELVRLEEEEMALYERNAAHVSYGYYVARRAG
ncbi:MAG: class I SAM-dependent methyltransferase [Alphaproteobacteria bacterium]|nr:class I SAM-dependent methyltransferase [Alphaproteobacteria bacterium]